MPLFRRINFPVSCVFSGSSPATRVLYVLINYHSAALLPTQSCPRLYLPSLIINSPSPYISLWFRLFFTVVFIFVFLHFCSLIYVHSFLLSPSLSLFISICVFQNIYSPPPCFPFSRPSSIFPPLPPIIGSLLHQHPSLVLHLLFRVTLLSSARSIRHTLFAPFISSILSPYFEGLNVPYFAPANHQGISLSYHESTLYFYTFDKSYVCQAFS